MTFGTQRAEIRAGAAAVLAFALVLAGCQRPNGAACSDPTQCASGFCADNVCCNAACNGGTCDSCALPSLRGTCSPVTPATECRASAGPCDPAETCGGALTCPADAKSAAGTVCSSDNNPCTSDV